MNSILHQMYYVNIFTLYIPVADTAVNTTDRITILFGGNSCVEIISILREPDSSEPVKLALVKPTLIAGIIIAVNYCVDTLNMLV